MSRHRNIRSLNYEDEYEGYDDVYGHSVEDNYGVSPGTVAQFTFDRHGRNGDGCFNEAVTAIHEENGRNYFSNPTTTTTHLQHQNHLQHQRLRTTQDPIMEEEGDYFVDEDNVYYDGKRSSGGENYVAEDTRRNYIAATTTTDEGRKESKEGDDYNSSNERRENRLRSCLDAMRRVVVVGGDKGENEAEMVEAAERTNFEPNAAVNLFFENQQRKERRAPAKQGIRAVIGSASLDRATTTYNEFSTAASSATKCRADDIPSSSLLLRAAVPSGPKGKYNTTTGGSNGSKSMEKLTLGRTSSPANAAKNKLSSCDLIVVNSGRSTPTKKDKNTRPSTTTTSSSHHYRTDQGGNFFPPATTKNPPKIIGENIGKAGAGGGGVVVGAKNARVGKDFVGRTSQERNQFYDFGAEAILDEGDGKDIKFSNDDGKEDEDEDSTTKKEDTNLFFSSSSALKSSVVDSPSLPLPTTVAATLTSGSSISKVASRARMDRFDVAKEYEKRKESGKDYLNLVVIGHVDAGKSTLMGHVLYQLGFVSKKKMHKFEQDSKKLGKGSFAFAWVLDETEEERSRGVTMDVAQTRFETANKMVTLIDSPGHKDFIPNMITGAAQADAAILVINATRGEFETGFEMGGQTREHTMLVRSLGVTQLIVAVNKMDTVDWSPDRYREIVKKLGQFVRQTGFREKEVNYIPCSGLAGENLTSACKEVKLTEWYEGPCLVEQIDRFKPVERSALDRPLRMSISAVFKGPGGGGLQAAGLILAGNVQAGDRVYLEPASETATVKGVSVDDNPISVGFAGDNVVLSLTGIDITKLSIGSIICDPTQPVQMTSYFRARIIVFDVATPINKGFHAVLHYQSQAEQVYVHRLVALLDRSSGEVAKKRPRCLPGNSSALVDLRLARPVCLETYAQFKDLGRFMLRARGATVAAGLVVQIFKSNPEAIDQSSSGND